MGIAESWRLVLTPVKSWARLRHLWRDIKLSSNLLRRMVSCNDPPEVATCDGGVTLIRTIMIGAGDVVTVVYQPQISRAQLHAHRDSLKRLHAPIHDLRDALQSVHSVLVAVVPVGWYLAEWDAVTESVTVALQRAADGLLLSISLSLGFQLAGSLLLRLWVRRVIGTVM